MTNAEKQEIIEAVLAALATNSKTIAQLSPKQSLEDSDLFEVAGGSRVTYLVLKNGIREGLALASQLSDYVTGEQAMTYLAKLDTETGTIDYMESPCVMLDGFKDVNGYSPATGDLFYENRSGYQIWTKTQGGATGEHANTHVAYINRNENAIYRWTGTTMERIGGCAVVNDLTTGGGDKALSAEQGCELRYKIEEVYQRVKNMYSLFGNIAFWDGKPAIGTVLPDLNWNVPKQTVTLSLNLTHAVVKHNGTEKSNGSTIQAEQGSTLILTVEPASGYALTSVSSSTTGATVSDNGNGTYSVSIVVGSGSMTLSITASADEMQHTITYNLTNCTATTKPTSVAQGGTATIVLQADSNYKMPSSLPSGAVTGASVTSYAVDANDNTKATLVIGSVTGNVTIAVNAEPVILFEKAKMYIVNVSPEVFAFRTSRTNSTDVNRACLTVFREGLANPCAWYNATSGQNVDTEAMALYSAIPIPSGTTKVSIKCNASYYYYPGVFTAEGRRQNDNPAWVLGSTKTEFDLVNTYPNATHFAVSFKIGSAGTTAFSNETYESMGIELTFE